MIGGDDSNDPMFKPFQKTKAITKNYGTRLAKPKEPEKRILFLVERDL